MSDERIEAAGRAIYKAWRSNPWMNAIPAVKGQCDHFAEVALAAADEVNRAMQRPLAGDPGSTERAFNEAEGDRSE